MKFVNLRDFIAYCHHKLDRHIHFSNYFRDILDDAFSLFDQKHTHPLDITAFYVTFNRYVILSRSFSKEERKREKETQYLPEARTDPGYCACAYIVRCVT